MSWHSLYIRTDDAAGTTITAATLIEVLSRQGYQRYDPFPGGMGTPLALKTFVRHFVSPVTEGWVRILGTPDPDTFVTLSVHYPLLHGWLSGSDGGIEVYQNGQKQSDLTPYLAPGKTADDLTRAIQGTYQAEPAKAGRRDQTKADALPDELQQFARERNVNIDQANRLINRLTSRVFGKLDDPGSEAGTMRDRARSMLDSGRIDWNSIAGRRLIALAEILALPATWRDPDFEVVREAYQVARMLRKNPRAQLMADEKAALKAIPNADVYEAVYMGK